eukprot:362546_1
MSHFQKIDTALGKYYTHFDRYDYYDKTGNGKFINFVNNNEYIEHDINLELGKDINANDCAFVDIFTDLPGVFNKDEIFYVLQYCYRYGVPPEVNTVERLLYQNKIPFQLDDTKVLQWKHIENAITHELYDEISSAFMILVNSNKRYENVVDLLDDLRKQKHIDIKEINCIEKLILKAKTFCAETPEGMCSKKEVSSRCISIMDDYISKNIDLCSFKGLSFATLSDIYNSHKCFIFSN